MKGFVILCFGLLISCSQTGEPEDFVPEIVAEAAIYSLDQVDERAFEVKDENVGKATFFQSGNVVMLEISLSGMTANTSKAVHIHNGTIEVPGRHWNRGSYQASCDVESLGSPWAKPFIGDVGNVTIDQSGNGSLTLKTDLWALNSGDEKDLLNKVIIVHNEPQDFVEECDPFHDHDHLHSNQKIGGGIIRLVSDIPELPQAVYQLDSPPDFTICK